MFVILVSLVKAVLNIDSVTFYKRILEIFYSYFLNLPNMMLTFMMLWNDFLNTRNDKSETNLTSEHQRVHWTQKLGRRQSL